MKRGDVVLYDQYDNAGAQSTSSQNFEAAFDAFDDELGDDFVVPDGETWNVNQVDVAGVYFNGTGPMTSANVNFYSDASGLPGSQVATRPGLTVGDTAGSLTIAIPSAVSLPAGHYWVSVQANMDFGAGGQWGWTTGPSGRTTKRPGRTQAAASPSARPGAPAARHAGSTPACPTRSSA